MMLQSMVLFDIIQCQQKKNNNSNNIIILLHKFIDVEKLKLLDRKCLFHITTHQIFQFMELCMFYVICSICVLLYNIDIRLTAFNTINKRYQLQIIWKISSNIRQQNKNRKNEIRNLNIDIIVIQPQIENNNQNRIFDNIYTTVNRKSHTINVLIAKYDFI